MTDVTTADDSSSQRPISTAMCIDGEALDRFRPVLRHLVVGLVDQAIHTRLVSDDTRIEALSLGPVQTLVHQKVVWPVAKRRTEQLLDALSGQPPTIVHAFTGSSYAVADVIAESFDADLVYQITSLADCDALAERTGPHIERFLALSRPLASVLTEQLAISVDRVKLIRPGVQAAKQASCFADPERIATIMCTSAFHRDSGIDRLITAVEVLRKRDRAVMVFLLGEGNKEALFRKTIRERGLSRWITLVNPIGDVGQAMRGADMFVRPASVAAVSADVLQAMGAGMAVVSIASDVCDHLRHNETALVCDGESGEALARSIELLLEDPSRARKMAASSMEYIRTHHSMSSMAQHTADTYRELALARATLSLPE